MPVWHAAAKQWIADERLVMVGITQEQHPDRCRLFAQWKQLDFPILWDPFNLTDSKVVPNFIAIDEHGIVQSIRADLESFETDFLAVEFPAPLHGGPQSILEGACSVSTGHHFTSSICSLTQGSNYDAAVEELASLARKHPDNARLAFRAGVAHRLRYDSAALEPSDFQSALEFWNKALALDPNQYIWRRRIQQYGPRSDKPYPFYSWVAEAREAIAARGETPIPLLAELTASELAAPRRAADESASAPTEPDPDGNIRRDTQPLVTIETAVALDTSDDRRAATVHIALRPNTALETHWNHESGPAVQLWIAGDEPTLLSSRTRDDAATSTEVLRFELERALEPEATALRLPAYALYYVCSGADGQCVYLRQDFEVVLEQP